MVGIVAGVLVDLADEVAADVPFALVLGKGRSTRDGDEQHNQRGDRAREARICSGGCHCSLPMMTGAKMLKLLFLYILS
jgi:hypothetical protein